MFGYIRLYRPELKLKDISKYSAAYCALCDQLKQDYGFIGRFLLSYDITFLLLFLNNFSEESCEEQKIRCPYNPIKVHTTQLSTDALHFSAFINYWLVTEKLYDDYSDNKNYLKLLIRKTLISKKGFKKNKENYKQTTELLSKLLHKVYEGETAISDCFDFDKTTNLFGEFFSEIFVLNSVDRETSDKLKTLLFQVGKWIYIIDAYDDFKKDSKKNKFNLFLALNNNSVSEENVFENALSLHLQLKYKITALINNLSDSITDDCLINILTFGLDNVFYEITSKKYKKFLWRLSNNGKSCMESMGRHGQ